MIVIVPLEDAHVLALDLQDDQRMPSVADALELARAQAGYGPAWAAVDGDEVLAIGGMCVSWETRAICWAGLSRFVGTRMLELTRKVRGLIDAQAFTRVEMFVDARHPTAIRWARLLGFENETPNPMRAFLPDGGAAYLYARTRP